MKVLFFSHQAEFIYGGEICSLELMHGLREQGVEIYFASPAGPYQERAKEYAHCFTVPSRQFRRNFLELPSFLISLLKTRRALQEIVQTEKIDIIHATSLKACVYVAFLSRIPKIWHHHDILPSKLSNRLWLKFLGSGVQHILTPSRAGAIALEQSGICAERISVIYNGFNISSWHPKTPKLSPIIQLAIIGEISFRKGSDWIKSLATLLSNRGAKFQLSIIGEGLSDTAFAAEVKNENEAAEKDSKLIFMGRRDDIATILQKTDLLLVPSRQDPLPTVIVEAFLSGVPALGTRVGGIPEMITDKKNGFLCDTPEEMANRIIEISGQPETYASMSISARSTAEEKFSLQRMTQETISIYKKLKSKVDTEQT